MKIFIEYDNKVNISKIIKQIKLIYNDSEVHTNDNCILSVILNNDTKFSEPEIKKLEENYKKINGVLVVTVSPIYRDDVKHKNFHCFFDIDGTLTENNDAFTNQIREIFNNMKNDKMRIYLASGRNVPQIREDMKNLETEPYGIAENGGVIIGLESDNTYLFGNRVEPDKLDIYLQKHCPDIKEDINQAMRYTERIYLQTITLDQLCKYKDKAEINVDIHSSVNSFHVCHKGIDKFKAIKKLTSDLRFSSNDIIVAIGDSDMDIPMIRESKIGFAVKNASQDVVNIADCHLQQKHDAGIKEMYDKLKKLRG